MLQQSQVGVVQGTSGVEGWVEEKTVLMSRQRLEVVSWYETVVVRLYDSESVFYAVNLDFSQFLI